jgi:hypothetical protein
MPAPALLYVLISLHNIEILLRLHDEHSVVCEPLFGSNYSNTVMAGLVMCFFFSFSGWGETESTWYVGHCRPIVPAPDDR